MFLMGSQKQAEAMYFSSLESNLTDTLQLKVESKHQYNAKQIILLSSDCSFVVTTDN